MIERVRRRRFVAGVGAAVASLAGCTGFGNDGDESPTGPDETGATPTGEPEDSSGEPDGETATTHRSTETDASPTTATDGTDNPTGTTSGTTDDEDDLDLREANVVDVTFDRQDGAIEFDVTLFHDDDGEEKYANWWQVETLDGEQLGRRELLHAHSTAPFTRSETIEIPDGTTCVVVRGHDQIHGYGGQAAIVNLESEKTILVRQGAERQSYDASACP
jgi:hypothetical protein